jgi:hypothetical protein
MSSGPLASETVLLESGISGWKHGYKAILDPLGHCRHLSSLAQRRHAQLAITDQPLQQISRQCSF